MFMDPSTAIIKAHGKYAGPLAETEVCMCMLSILVGGKKSAVFGTEKKRKKREPPGRIELPTPGLRDQCSTTEL